MHDGNGEGKKMRKEEDCLSSVIKKSCAWQTHGFTRKRKGKSLNSAGRCKIEIDFVLVGKI